MNKLIWILYVARNSDAIAASDPSHMTSTGIHWYIPIAVPKEKSLYIATIVPPEYLSSSITAANKKLLQNATAFYLQIVRILNRLCKFSPANGIPGVTTLWVTLVFLRRGFAAAFIAATIGSFILTVGAAARFCVLSRFVICTLCRFHFFYLLMKVYPKMSKIYIHYQSQ